MSEAATTSPSKVDRWIDRLLAIGADAGLSDPTPRLRAFETILLIHLFVTLLSGAFPRTNVGSELQYGLAAALGGCLSLRYSDRLGPIGTAGAMCVMLALLTQTFPETGNHEYLELWLLSCFVYIGTKTRDESYVLLSTLRWMIAVMMFYTGLQKVLYGTYFDAQFLSVQIMLKDAFANVFGLMIPAEELQRLQSIRWNVMGSGPVSSDAPLLLLASNAVYLFELAIPFALLWHRTRAAAVIALLVFTVAIQSGAREAFFGGLLVSSCLLFWPRDLHSRWLWGFVAYYGAIAFLRLVFPEVVLR